jgi:hypothetical protein
LAPNDVPRKTAPLFNCNNAEEGASDCLKGAPLLNQRPVPDVVELLLAKDLRAITEVRPFAGIDADGQNLRIKPNRNICQVQRERERERERERKDCTRIQMKIEEIQRTKKKKEEGESQKDQKKEAPDDRKR